MLQWFDAAKKLSLLSELSGVRGKKTFIPVSYRHFWGCAGYSKQNRKDVRALVDVGHIEASVERNVDHPVLRLVGKHGETETFQMGIVGYECAQGFCVDIVFGFYFYRPYLVSILQKEVEFDGRVADTIIIYREIQCAELGEHIQIRKSPLIFCEDPITYKHRF